MLVPLREVPRIERIRALAERYPSVDPPTVEAYLALLVVASDVGRERGRFLGGRGIAEGRFVVLMLLMHEEAGRASPSELAERAGVTRATMTGLLDGLQRDGLVDRTSHPEDRRRTVVELTERGQARLDDLLPDYFRFTTAVMGRLGESERATLVKLLGKVKEGVAAAARGESP